jgi:GNAT superfamily N-acetyltransferase
MDAVEIREATKADAAEIVRMIRALAAASYRRRPMIAPVTEASVIADGFGSAPCFTALLAWRGSEAVGLAQYCSLYAAWRGEKGVAIANLYVAPDERRGGLGRRLVASVAGRALAAGARRLELQVEAENPARDFYRAVGFALLTDIRCRMEVDQIGRLAAEEGG